MAAWRRSEVNDKIKHTTHNSNKMPSIAYRTLGTHRARGSLSFSLFNRAKLCAWFDARTERKEIDASHLLVCHKPKLRKRERWVTFRFSLQPFDEQNHIESLQTAKAIQRERRKKKNNTNFKTKNEGTQKHDRWLRRKKKRKQHTQKRTRLKCEISEQTSEYDNLF